MKEQSFQIPNLTYLTYLLYQFYAKFLRSMLATPRRFFSQITAWSRYVTWLLYIYIFQQSSALGVETQKFSSKLNKL